MPISTTQGKPLRINLVDDGPHGAFKIDVMGAYCLLDEVKDLFQIRAQDHEGWKVVDGNNIKFPFASQRYDYVNGEIPGYSPSAMLECRKMLYNNSEATPFKRYLGTGKAGPKNKSGHSMVRVRFYVEPTKKQLAEKLIKKSLPEEIFKTNYNGETVSISEQFKLDKSILVADNSTIAGKIINAGVKVSSYLNKVKEGYQQGGRNLIPASKKNLNDFKFVSMKGTDCSGGVSWILLEAGLINVGENKTFYPPGTGIWRSYKNGWPNKELPLVPGVKGVPVPIEQVQPGDIILWDRNKSSNNHVLIYAGPGQVFDFGSTKSVNSIQPLSRSHLSKVAGGCWAWRIVQDTQIT